MKYLNLSLKIIFIGFVVFVGGCGDDSDEKALSGWAVGESVDGYGTIIHTNDRGKNSVRQGSQSMIPDVSFGDVNAVDHKNAWVVGSSSDGYGTILRTMDGGETWIRQGSNLTIPDVDLSGVSSVDGDVAWAVGEKGVVLNIIDGGATWVQQAQGMFPDALFQSLSAHDRNNVWAVGTIENNTTALIIHTIDGGETWIREGEADIPPDPSRYYCLIDVHAIHESTAWAVGSRGSVSITTDSGKSWFNKSWWDERACCGAGLTDYNGVCAVSDLTEWKALDPAGVCLTTNGGDSWNI